MSVPLAQRLESRVAAGDLDVPVLPHAAREVFDACAGDDCDISRLAEMVRRDPALAAHFLRLANSPLFGSRSSIVSLPQALARLGTSQTRQIALLVTCQARAFDCRTRTREAHGLRRRAVATAMWAQEIARLRRLNVEESFLCGLLGDIGVPALWQLADEIRETADVRWDPADVDADIERLHDSVGAEIVGRWGLPARIVEAIRLHHVTLPAGAVVATGAGATVEATIATVQLADTLARATVENRACELATTQAHPSVVALSLYGEDLEQLLARTDSILDAIRAFS